MPVIPTYDQKETLDPGSAPQINLDNSQAKAEASVGEALKGIGATVSDLFEHIGEKQAQTDKFTAGLQYEAQRNDVQSAMDAAKQSMQPDGSGFVEDFQQRSDTAFKARLAQVPLSQQSQFAQRWAIERQGWDRHAIDTQLAQRRNFDVSALQNTTQDALGQLYNNPNDVDTIVGNVQNQINSAPGLSATDKVVATQGARRTIYFNFLQQKYANDPEGLARELHMRVPDGAMGQPGTASTPAPQGDFPTQQTNLPAGMRNNNPGNIKFSGTNADPGIVGPSSNTDQGDRQAVFASQQDGMNAAARLMLRKFDNGKTTINSLVAERGGWTPGNYDAARNIAATAGVRPDQPLDLSSNPGQFRAVIRGLITQEHGPASKLYSDNMIDSAVARASGQTASTGQRQAPLAYAPTEVSSHHDGDSPLPVGLDANPGSAGAAPQTAAAAGGPAPAGNVSNSALIPYLAKGKGFGSVTNLNTTFGGRLSAALAHAPPEVQQGTVIGSGFRTREEQEGIAAKAQAEHGADWRKWAAMPGHSNHEKGLATDLGFSNDAARQWWHANATTYGLKFPLPNEDWHIEPQETRGAGPPLQASVHPRDGEPVPAGGSFNPKYSALTFADTQQLMAGASASQQRMLKEQQQQLKLQSFDTQRLVDDDVQSLQATGKGVDNLDPAQVQAVLGPDKAQAWQSQRAFALDVYKSTSGMDSMSNDELEGHAEQFHPGLQDAGEGYGRRAALYGAVHKKAEDILEQRSKDPAEAVSTSPNVVAAQQQVGANNTVQARENLIAARITAQQAVGVPKYAQSPITEDEAKSYAAKMRPLSRGQAEVADQDQVINGIVQEIGDRYGRYAPEVLRRVMYAVTLKQDAADVLSDAITRMQKTNGGPLVPTTDSNRLATGQQADDIARQSGAASAGARSGLPRASYLDAVDKLRKDPQRLMPFFVQRYGIDRVPNELRSKPAQRNAQ